MSGAPPAMGFEGAPPAMGFDQVRVKNTRAKWGYFFISTFSVVVFLLL